MFSTTFIPLLLASYVSAHGYIAKVIINGKEYGGNVPNGRTDPSIVRQIGDVSPVKGAGNRDMFCGINEQRAELIADAMPGDSISFDWRGGDNSFWPHNTGPMFTYMADCGDSCANFDDRQAKWFKIQQVGRKAKGEEWAQADLMKGATADLKIPATLAPGNYLIRHEIIGLHLAEEQGGAEFYPGCAQLRIGGNQKGRPQEDEMVTFPGGYSDNDPGIHVNAFNPDADYVFPGPNVARFVDESPSSGNGGSSGNGNGNGGNGSSQPPSNGNGTSNGNNGGKNNGGKNGNTPSTSSQASTSGGQCRLKKREQQVVYVTKRADGMYEEVDKMDVVRMYRPKHLSRIMKRLLNTQSM